MEEIQEIKSRPWICQTRLPVRDFISNCISAGLVEEHRLLDDSFTVNLMDEVVGDIANYTSTNESFVREDIKAHCHRSQLDCADEDRFLCQPTKLVPDITDLEMNGLFDEVHLETVQSLRNRTTKRKKKRRLSPTPTPGNSQESNNPRGSGEEDPSEPGASQGPKMSPQDRLGSSSHLQPISLSTTMASSLSSGNPSRTNPSVNPSSNPQSLSTVSSNSVSDDSDPKAVLTIETFLPTDPSKESFLNRSFRSKELIVDTEVAVLSSNNLKQLADMISHRCPTTFAPTKKISRLDNPSQQPSSSTSFCDKEGELDVGAEEDAIASEVYKSFMFFIDNTFYNFIDCSGGTPSTDYSEVILKWLEKCSKEAGIGKLTKCPTPMEEVQFADLTIQLGYPYLFVHSGDCEHLLVFKDIKLWAGRPPAYLYPIPLRSRPATQIKCGLCHLNVAKWMTRENQRVNTNPFFFCDQCHKDFNFDQDGNLRQDSLLVQAYVDRVSLAS